MPRVTFITKCLHGIGTLTESPSTFCACSLRMFCFLVYGAKAGLRKEHPEVYQHKNTEGLLLHYIHVTEPSRTNCLSNLAHTIIYCCIYISLPSL